MTELEPRRVYGHRHTPMVGHQLFLLADPQAPGDPLQHGPPRETRLIKAGPGGVVLRSAGDDFYPEVQVEVWDGPPPPDGEDVWEVREETDFECPTGRLRLRSVEGLAAGPDLSPGDGGRYRLRAHVRGRATARARLGHDLYYYGVEEWLLQVWPAAPTATGGSGPAEAAAEA
ncbi:MAG: hypothetical protein GEV11_18115 [Streptosporangiales bacterium]|nr:hypothetical protein [Streptosporangiales bacterium]